jgi:peroxiredoxin
MRRLLCLLAIALALAGCGPRPDAPLSTPAAAPGAVVARDGKLLDRGSGKLAVGDPAPDFSYTLPDGATTRLSDLRGTPIVLNFWATWCLPCREEMPELEAAYAGGDGGLAVLGVNRNELPDAIARFTAEVPVTFPLVANVDGSIADRYGVTSLPTTYFIRSDGTIGAIQIGVLTPERLDERLKAIR